MSLASRSAPVSRHQSLGLSLIELLVALSIGAFLVLGVTTVFLANRDSAQVENSLARLQENGRFALDLIRDDLHRAQYLGCNTGDVFVINMIDDPNSATFVNSIEGVQAFERDGGGSWAAQPPSGELNTVITAAETAQGARNGSDVLRIRTTELLNEDDPNDPLLTARVLPVNTSVSIDDNPSCDIEQGSQVVLTDCALTAHVFQVTNAQSCNAASPPNATTLEYDNSSNFTVSINPGYQTTAQLLLFEDATWFVADTFRDRNGFDVWALYREVDGVRQEMIEGVEHMQVKFGQRVAGTDSIRYVNPSDAELNTGTNSDAIISVRIALLMQGFDFVRDNDDPRVYVLIDEQVGTASATGLQGALHASGPVQRDVFTTTVMLRNAPEI